MVCSIKDYKDLNFMAVEKMEGSLLAHEEKIKRRKFMHPSMDFKVRKITKEMDNGEVMEEKKVILII